MLNSLYKHVVTFVPWLVQYVNGTGESVGGRCLFSPPLLTLSLPFSSPPSLSLSQSMSGIEVEAGIGPLYDDIKLRSKHKWVTFKIENKKKVVVDQLGEPAKTDNKEDDKAKFDEIKGQLTKEPRYILYDFGFTNKEGRKIQKLAFIFW